MLRFKGYDYHNHTFFSAKYVSLINKAVRHTTHNPGGRETLKSIKKRGRGEFKSRLMVGKQRQTRL